MSSSTFDLPLFPLQTVLFPGGLLSLKVFEARYLDLVGSCLRESKPFGVVMLKQGSETRRGNDSVSFESLGTMAELIDVDSAQTGILQVRCRGTHRFDVRKTRREDDGLWIAKAGTLPDDEAIAPAEAMHDTVKGLANAIATLKAQGAEPFLAPYLFDQAGWVANRWCEILPISLAAKQKLMELPDAQVRLQLVDEFLRSKGVV
ncbi:LON peptidase substrate-binding domain-containing protein [Piscinibacter sp. XHJ-5]|uniref:LON peptidase substrate-binding domain-containing protein n=1 Tax=Piscinibacter sp. XHJ-5 TaxID=3037797 RepID=UPI002452DD6F|nr:LON peptidase substrate-binding domain-containing protein [Piscinibacter sp. XHJ-5]